MVILGLYHRNFQYLPFYTLHCPCSSSYHTLTCCFHSSALCVPSYKHSHRVAPSRLSLMEKCNPATSTFKPIHATMMSNITSSLCPKCIMEQTSILHSPRKFNMAFSGLMSSTSNPLMPQLLANDLPSYPTNASVSEFFVHVPWFPSHFKDRTILASTYSQSFPGSCMPSSSLDSSCSGHQSLLYYQCLTLCKVISTSFASLLHVWYDLSEVLDHLWSHLKRTSISNPDPSQWNSSITTSSYVFLLTNFLWIFVATIEWNTPYQCQQWPLSSQALPVNHHHLFLVSPNRSVALGTVTSQSQALSSLGAMASTSLSGLSSQAPLLASHVCQDSKYASGLHFFLLLHFFSTATFLLDTLIHYHFMFRCLPNLYFSHGHFYQPLPQSLVQSFVP